MKKPVNKALLANRLWKVSCFPAYRRFVKNSRRLQHVQESYLRNLLYLQRETEFGRSHGFAQIASYEDFVERVPPSDYRVYQPFVQRIRSGAKAQLTREEVRLLEPTSGTTAATKLIPYTDRLRREFQAAISPWIYALFRRFPATQTGRAYWAVSPNTTIETDGDDQIPVGFDHDAAYLGRIEQLLVRNIMAVPREVQLLQNMDAFRYATLRFLLGAADLRLISVWNPTFLQLLLEALPQFWNQLITDINDGTITLPGNAPAEVVESFIRYLAPDSRRADQLAGLTAANRLPEKIWPDLQVISCWNAAWAAVPAGELMQQFTHAHLQPKGLLATEAIVTFPFYRPGEKDPVFPLAANSHFFEFEELNGGEILPAWRLKTGGQYTVLVTTGGGLYRYRLNDRVRVDGYLNTLPLLSFEGKTARFLDLRGEKISEDLLRKILKDVLPESVGDQSIQVVTPVYCEDNVPAYTLFARRANRDPDTVATDIEERLQQNYHYHHCRQLGQLQAFAVYWLSAQQEEQLHLLRTRESGGRVSTEKPALLLPPAKWLQQFAMDIIAEKPAMPKHRNTSRR